MRNTLPNAAARYGSIGRCAPDFRSCKHVYVYVYVYVDVDGGKVISQFFAADLIDDVRVGILPIVLGGGIRLFPGGEGEHRLVLERHHVYRSGMVQLEYRVQRLGEMV